MPARPGYLRSAMAAGASGLPLKGGAQRLSLSPGTVRSRLSAATHKLGARNRAEAAQIAREKGWL